MFLPSRIGGGLLGALAEGHHVGRGDSALGVNPCSRTFWVGLLKQRDLTLELGAADKGLVTDGHDFRNTC